MFAVTACSTILAPIALLITTLATTHRLTVATDHVHIEPLAIALYLVTTFNLAFPVGLVGTHPVDDCAVALDGVLGQDDHFFCCFGGCHCHDSFPIALAKNAKAFVAVEVALRRNVGDFLCDDELSHLEVHLS